MKLGRKLYANHEETFVHFTRHQKVSRESSDGLLLWYLILCIYFLRGQKLSLLSVCFRHLFQAKLGIIYAKFRHKLTGQMEHSQFMCVCP